MNALLIFIGAGIGGVTRYWISNLTYHFLNRGFPYGTLFVNVTGCFLMGLLYPILLERVSGFDVQLRAFLLIGLLGGYTTFSSFSIETLNLFENGNWSEVISNILLSVMLCLGATWLGLILGRNV